MDPKCLLLTRCQWLTSQTDTLSCWMLSGPGDTGGLQVPLHAQWQGHIGICPSLFISSEMTSCLLALLSARDLWSLSPGWLPLSGSCTTL